MQPSQRRISATIFRYKGEAHEIFVTFDLEQDTRSGSRAINPKVKRAFVPGTISDWKAGRIQKKSGREVTGVQIDYLQSRRRHRRQGYLAHRSGAEYYVAPSFVEATIQRFSQVVDLPEGAHNVQCYTEASGVPERYRSALRAIR